MFTRTRVMNSSIDRYNIDTGAWNTITHVPTPRFHAGIVNVGKKIYFIGGFYDTSMCNKNTATIECYDIPNDAWTILEKYPQDIWEHFCAIMYVPKCREDMEVVEKIDSTA